VNRRTAATAVFGSFDGATSAVGALAGLLATNATPHSILVVCVGLAIAGGVSMGAGDWLADAPVDQAAVMGAATLIGSALPALPFVVWAGAPAYAAAGLLTLALAVVIAELRRDQEGPSRGSDRVRAYTVTFLIIVVASGLSAAASVLLGATG
jgi:hypothetical protein